MQTFSPTFIERLSRATRVAALTGAGASADSGIPTFRDPEGLWTRYDATQLATADGFRGDPVLVQSWYSARRANVLAAQPHEGHLALAELEQLFESFLLITQNVDGLHTRAGSRNVVELHGSLLKAVCMECGEACEPLELGPSATSPTRCSCGGLVRPEVVWFGEMLEPVFLQAAERAATSCDIFLSIGTGADVFPAAALPILALKSGAYVVEINPRPTVLSSDVSEVVRGRAVEVLPALLDIAKTMA
jgi:NAD-dependent deacetylase